MKIKKEEVLKLKLSGNDVKNFKSVIKELCSNTIGFSKSISTEELDTINKINNKL